VAFILRAAFEIVDGVGGIGEGLRGGVSAANFIGYFVFSKWRMSSSLTAPCHSGNE